jgi:acetylornithine deacetylase
LVNSPILMEDIIKSAKDLLSSLISIPSLSKEEDKRADFLYQHFKDLNHIPSRIGNNIILGNTEKNDRKKILLNSHIDTVKPANSYTLDPYKPIIKEGKLYGLGSNDAGASLVSLFAAYQHVINTNQSYDLIYVASAEEEISGQNGIAKVIDHIGNVDLAIVGEPTGMQMATAEKGLLVIDAIAHGVSGHAARNEGVNAIYIAIKDIESIRTFDFEKVSDLLGKTKATVTMVNAGSQHNVVPDQCKFVVDIRSNELYTLPEIHSLLQAHVQSTLTPRSFRLNPSRIDHDHPIVKKGISLGLSCYGSPTLSDQALMPYLSIKIGPGQSSRSHTADEYIELSEIDHGIKTYIDLLNGLEL